ncbi:beta strand repeat-containing protein [Pseudomonas sp. KNUC1026]|uniref:beta strand repeat-containing protein n=1 Tax=Pseudomonas sp. KNUC1026 TaxID=2893890 RepID=UPI001F3F68AF|nr:YDG domain-containing protein [Pseudomonas sp. KNUC1026]UFH50974.1 YDG domain-containing protein [Pseudomonas sp. KNUC1026]
MSAIGSDVVSVAGSGAGSTFADKNAGTGKAVVVSGYTLTGADAGNYNLIAPTGLMADIAKASLNITGVTANNRTYDATTNATLAGTAAVAAFGSDVVNVTGAGSATFADKNAGSGKAVTVTGYTLGGADAGNYDAVQPTGLTATINKASLSVAGVSVADKVYDGTTSATLAGTAAVEGVAGDDVSVAGSGSAVFVDKNAGVNKAVNVSGYALGGLDAGNYTLTPSAGLSATISKLDLLLTGLSVSNKVYDGTTAATLSGTGSVTALGSDVVSVGGSGAGSTFVDKNAGMGKAATVNGYTLTGADAGNYNLVAPTGLTADIAKADLNVTGVTALSRTYDGTTNALLAGTAVVAAFGSDVVNVTGPASATFADKNAGSSKAVTVIGYSLSGADAGNYNTVQPTGLTATINKANLSVVGVSVADKAYDGTTSATLTGTAAVAGVAGDDVSLTGSGSAAFADRNAGINKAVNVSGYSLAGLDAGNYTLTPSSGLSATISKLDLLLTGLGVSNKVYDGSTAAVLTGSGSITALGSDAVSVNGSGVGAFTDKHAGTGKVVTVSGYTLTGTDAGNYSLVLPSNLTANITPASLSLSGITANNKVFDGTQRATTDIRNAVLAGLVGGDAVNLVSNGTFVDAAVGSGKVVNLSNSLSGSDSANYTLSGQTTTLADITIAPASIATPVATLVTAGSLRTTQNAVAQVLSANLPTQATAQPRALMQSTTLEVRGLQQGGANANESNENNGNTAFVNTSVGFGAQAPMLSIQNGGVQLPPVAVSVSE